MSARKGGLGARIAEIWSGFSPQARRGAVILVVLLVAWCFVYVNDRMEWASSQQQAQQAQQQQSYQQQQVAVTVAEAGEWDGEHASVVVDGNVPSFTEFEVSNAATGYESYSELDGLGRCGVAEALVGPETVPEKGEERESISSVKPSGWNNAKYTFVDGGYLYNRCHLIGWQLTAENANGRNLVTGTRYMNVDGMLPYENEVADYVKSTGNHVLYRVTPVFEGDELVCRGVEMEALSVEDGGEGVRFHVYAYNVQPGVGIDYSDGSSHAVGQPAS